MLGRLLCWLGFHDVIITHPLTLDADGNYWRSPMGCCTRCNKPYQWDQ
jgi:hypothetical protein